MPKSNTFKNVGEGQTPDWMEQLFGGKEPKPALTPDEEAQRVRAALSLELYALRAGGSNVLNIARSAGEAARDACIEKDEG